MTSDDQLFFRVMGELVRGETSETFAALDAVRRAEVLETARRFELDHWFYFRLHGSGADIDALAPMFRAGSGFELRYGTFLAKLEKKLAGLGLEYALLKGARLAYGYYPHPGLRVRGDFDILLRSEGAKRFYQALRDEGGVTWEADIPGRQHLPMLSFRGGYCVEVHRSLFSDERMKFDENLLWSCCPLDPDGNGFRHDLLPELHWLMRVNSLRYDDWIGMHRVLIDLLRIQKTAVLDRNLIVRLDRDFGFGAELGMPYAAVPEFWQPDEVLFRPEYPPRIAACLHRALFERIEVEHDVVKHYDTFLAVELRKHQNILAKLGFLLGRMWIRPAALTDRYHVTFRRPLRFAWCYAVDISTKAAALCRFVFSRARRRKMAAAAKFNELNDYFFNNKERKEK